jgi:hypothetical protein
VGLVHRKFVHRAAGLARAAFGAFPELPNGAG